MLSLAGFLTLRFLLPFFLQTLGFISFLWYQWPFGSKDHFYI